MIVEGVKSAYEIGPLVAVNNTYRLYLTRRIGDDVDCVMQVAKSIEHNGGLSRASFILDELAETARRYDTLYAKDHDGKRLHYDRLYPQVVESFVIESQANRRANILEFTDVEDARKLLPISNLRSKDRVILDLKSGAWVMGRLLKLLDFVHSRGIVIRSLRPNNILLDPAQHFAIVLDWTDAFVFQDRADSASTASDIVRAAETVLTSCGIDGQGLPYELDAEEKRFVALLRDFAEASESDARRAHGRFYQVTREIWEPKFHPFTTLPL